MCTAGLWQSHRKQIDAFVIKKMTFIEKRARPQSFGSADPFIACARCGKIQQEHDLLNVGPYIDPV